MKEIYLIRHGETEYNRMGMVQGSGINEPLNKAGLTQAEMFFRAYRHIAFDRIYTSALLRAQQSVDAFLTGHTPHEIHPGLNEISWGVFEGKILNKDQKMEFQRMVHAWGKGQTGLRLPGGESADDVLARMKNIISLLHERTDEERVLICMHGRAMKVFLCGMMNIPLTEMDKFHHKNLCLYVLNKKATGKFELTLSNNTDHLL